MIGQTETNSKGQSLMIAPASGPDNERINEAREKLQVLMNRGFKFIVSDENGDVWVGSDKGLEIQEAIDTPFMGTIQIDQ